MSIVKAPKHIRNKTLRRETSYTWGNFLSSQPLISHFFLSHVILLCVYSEVQRLLWTRFLSMRIQWQNNGYPRPSGLHGLAPMPWTATFLFFFGHSFFSFLSPLPCYSVLTFPDPRVLALILSHLTFSAGYPFKVTFICHISSLRENFVTIAISRIFNVFM